MTTPTTPSAILTDFVATIKAIVPAEAGHEGEGFTFVRSRALVDEAGLRAFTLEIEPVGDGTVVGCGNDFKFDLRVVTSYKGLQLFDAQCLVQEDNHQIWQALALRAGALTGLFHVLWQEPGFEYEDKTDGKVWGSHLFRVRYLAASDY